MNAAIAFIRAVDRVNEVVGRVVAWLTFGTVAVCFLVVVLRYVFSIGFVWMQELYVWQHAVVFMAGAKLLDSVRPPQPAVVAGPYPAVLRPRPVTGRSRPTDLPIGRASRSRISRRTD